MILSIEPADLSEYTSRQLNYFFPDNELVELRQENKYITETLHKIEHCFSHVTLNNYSIGKDILFNHLYSDHYVMFLWFLSNIVYKDRGKCHLANKIYYLNKILHAFDCMFDTELPSIFLLLHTTGTMLGKATYSDFFVVLQGCTIGANHGIYPKIGKGVTVNSNSSIIGNCTIGNKSTISTRTTVFQKNIPDNSTVYMNFETGQLQIKPSKECYTQQFFNVDLNKV